MTHTSRVFDALKPKLTPVQVCAAHRVDPLNLLMRGVFRPHKLRTERKPGKWSRFPGPLCFGCNLLQPKTTHAQIYIS